MLTEWITQLHNTVTLVTGFSSETQIQILKSMLIVLLLTLGRRIVLAFALQRTDDATARYRWSRTSTVIMVLLGLAIVGRVWFKGFGDVMTYFGLITAALAIALQDLLKNFAGWVFLVWRRPFRLGDRVQIGEQTSDVIDIRLFQFTILEVGNWVAADQSTGRVIHVPNGRLFTEPLCNYYSGFAYIWSELPVLVTFESDWRLAKSILADVARKNALHMTPAAAKRIREASSKYMIFYTHLDPIVYTSVADSGVMLTMRYLVEPRRRRGTDQIMWEQILDAFAKVSEIDFAYPTVRYFAHNVEGKPVLAAQGQ